MWDRAAAGSASVHGCSTDSISTRASSRRAIAHRSSSMYACLYQPPQADDDQRRTRGTRRENRVENSASSALRQAQGIPSLSRDASSASNVVAAVAQGFSPRYECHHAGGQGPPDRTTTLVTIDVSGLDRLLGPPRVIGEELRRA